MGLYRVKETGDIKNQGEIRRDYPNVSLPRVWGANVHETLGIDPIFTTPKPEASSDLKMVTSNGIEQDANGNWVEAWVEQDRFADYADDDGTIVTRAEQETAYLAEKQKQAENKVRDDRNKLLAETDYLALSDVTMSAEMATYRQALRDITDHENFPYLEDADWPVKP